MGPDQGRKLGSEHVGRGLLWRPNVFVKGRRALTVIARVRDEEALETERGWIGVMSVKLMCGRTWPRMVQGSNHAYRSKEGHP